MGLDYWNWLLKKLQRGSYTWTCPECGKDTLTCYDSLDRTKTICDCGNCGYHSETSLDEIELEEEPEEQ